MAMGLTNPAVLIIVVIMNIAVTAHWEDFVRQLIATGRYHDAGEVVRAALRKLEETEGERFPAGSLKHLYSRSENEKETKMARRIRVASPAEV
jgi:putative addiction module CopG family antidote